MYAFNYLIDNFQTNQINVAFNDFTNKHLENSELYDFLNEYDYDKLFGSMSLPQIKQVVTFIIDNQCNDYDLTFNNLAFFNQNGRILQNCKNQLISRTDTLINIQALASNDYFLDILENVFNGIDQIELSEYAFAENNFVKVLAKDFIQDKKNIFAQCASLDFINELDNFNKTKLCNYLSCSEDELLEQLIENQDIYLAELTNNRDKVYALTYDLNDIREQELLEYKENIKYNTFDHNLINFTNSAVKAAPIATQKSLDKPDNITIILPENPLISDNAKLDNTNLDNNESIQLLTPLPSNKITPRYWQQKAINDVENAITHGKNRLLISAPTGSGKAYLLMFIIQQLLQANKRILLLVDRIKLVDQLCESAKIFNFDYNKIQGSIRDYNNDRLLTIASIQTYFNNPVATEYDVIIQDECHSQYSALTEYLQNHKGTAIGCTATPYSAGLIDIYTYLIETQTAAELTADKVLTPLRPFEMREIDMVGAKIVAGEWAANDVHKRSAKIYGDVVREFRCSHVYDKQGIVFCANIAHCNDVAERFIRANVTCAVYCSMQSLKERQEILAKFDNNEIQLLISVATLSKGFDRPQIEVILDLRPLRKSLNEYIQMIGRGIRANKGKNECVLLDFSGNWDRFKDKVLLAHNHGAGLLLDVINANVSTKQLKRNSKRLNTVRTQSITNNPLTELTNGVQLVESEFTASNDNNLFVPPPSRKIGILKTIFNFLRK